jgi:hypothetical protein
MNYNGYDPALSSSYYLPKRPYPAPSTAYDPYYIEGYGPSTRYNDYTERPSPNVWSQKIPIEKKYIEYVPQQKLDYFPV